ncbi:MAG: hypothetical protein ACRYG6_00565 [Janthinobacterium lividum]
MTDSTQPQDVAGAASGTGQGMPRTGTGRAASVDVATRVLATRVLATQALATRASGRTPWRTLPPAEPWRSPEPPRSAP